MIYQTKIYKFLSSKTGRKEFALRLIHRSFFIIFPLAFVYRRTIIRKVKIVAVIGSLGKTTTVKTIKVALGNFNTDCFYSNLHAALLFSILKISPFAKYKVIEVAIGKPGDMVLTGKAILPDIVVFTSIGTDHIKDFKGIEHILNEKVKMLKYLRKDGHVFANGDDKRVIQKVKEYGVNYTSFGKNEGNEIRCKNVFCNLRMGLSFTIQNKKEEYSVKVKLYNEKMVYSVMPAFGVALKLDSNPSRILAHLENLRPAIGRMQVETLLTGVTVIGDYFKATVDSVKPAFEMLKKSDFKRIIIIMASFNKLSVEKGSWQNAAINIGNDIAQFASRAIFVGEMAEFYSEGATNAGMKKNQIFKVNNAVDEIMACLPTKLESNDAIYISGKTTDRMECVFLTLKNQSFNCKKEKCTFYSYCKDCSSYSNCKDFV